MTSIECYYNYNYVPNCVIGAKSVPAQMMSCTDSRGCISLHVGFVHISRDMRRSRWLGRAVSIGIRVWPHPLENHNAVKFLRGTSMDPPFFKNHKAGQPAFSVRPITARQRNAISMVRLNKVAQWTTIAHLGASIMFGDIIIYYANRQAVVN